MIYGSLQQLDEQLPQSPQIVRAFQWLRRVVAGEGEILQRLESLEPGATQRVEIDGEAIFANLMCYETTPACEKLEAHRKYADIQYIYRGSEGLAWAPVGQLAEVDPYDPAKDVAFYRPNEHVVELRLPAGHVVCLYPSDAHGLGFTPGHRDGRERVQKIVVKVAL